MLAVLMSKNKVTKAPKQRPSDELVLLFSFSFEEGALLTQEAFIAFLKNATRDEVSSMEYSFISAEEARLSDFPTYSLYDLPAELLRSYEAH